MIIAINNITIILIDNLNNKNIINKKITVIAI